MGLGKTVQVLALLQSNRTPAKNSKLPSLVVAPRSLVYKAEISQWQGDWTAALNMALDSMSIETSYENVYHSLFAAIGLGEWGQVKHIYEQHNTILNRRDRIEILKAWGDEALSLTDLKPAIDAYTLLKQIAGDDPSSAFRLIAARTNALGFRKTEKDWQDASKTWHGIWQKASKAELEFYRFLEGPAGQI
jgi:hypothetical protein